MIRAASELAQEALSARRVGFLGGTFDPPHEGHLHLARRAREARDLDHVLWVPAARPPHKPGLVLAEETERARMLELLLCEETSGSSIWTVEFGRGGPSYTVDTLRSLRSLLAPAAQLFLVLGSDNLPGLAGWRDVEEVLALAEPIVVPRRPSEVQPESLPAALAARLSGCVLQGEAIDVSSTEVRRLLAAGAERELAALVPAALREYLLASGIYRAR